MKNRKKISFLIIYSLLLRFQVYQGPNTKFEYNSLPASTEVRFRVCAVRLMNVPSGSPGPIKGVFTPVTSARTMTPKKKKKISESSADGDQREPEVKETTRVSLTDKQWAMIFFSGFSLLVIAVILLLPSLFGVSD